VLVEFVSKMSSSDLSLFVIRSLTNSPSSVHFDGLTGTKTVATVVHKVLPPTESHLFTFDLAQNLQFTHTGCCR